MANVDSPFGLRPAGNMHGAPHSGGIRTFSTASGDSVAIFLGDPVKLSGTSSTVNGEVYEDVDQAATGDVMAGVVVGVIPTTADSLIYRAASTTRLLLVNTDPDTIYEIQEVSGGTALTAAAIGLNANFVVGSGSTVSGWSGVELNNSGEADTNTLDLKLVGLVRRADNEVGEHAKWLVQINRSQWANQIAGIA